MLRRDKGAVVFAEDGEPCIHALVGDLAREAARQAMVVKDVDDIHDVRVHAVLREQGVLDGRICAGESVFENGMSDHAAEFLIRRLGGCGVFAVRCFVKDRLVFMMAELRRQLAVIADEDGTARAAHGDQELDRRGLADLVDDGDIVQAELVAGLLIRCAGRADDIAAVLVNLEIIGGSCLAVLLGCRLVKQHPMVFPEDGLPDSTDAFHFVDGSLRFAAARFDGFFCSERFECLRLLLDARLHAHVFRMERSQAIFRSLDVALERRELRLRRDVLAQLLHDFVPCGFRLRQKSIQHGGKVSDILMSRSSERFGKQGTFVFAQDKLPRRFRLLEFAADREEGGLPGRHCGAVRRIRHVCEQLCPLLFQFREARIC